MPPAYLNESTWSDVHFVAEPYPTISYRTALTVYEESLVQGRFVGRGWNGAGCINPDDIRLNPQQHPTPQAFNLEIEGQLLASHWEWGGIERSGRLRPYETGARRPGRGAADLRACFVRGHLKEERSCRYPSLPR